MLQTTVLIRLTGMLLLTPNSQAGALPMHVLMPDRGMYVRMRHTPEIGFTTPADKCGPRPGSSTDPHAFAYDSVEGVCYVNMAGWSMEIGKSPPTPAHVALPTGTNNLSAVLQRYVDRSLLGDTPDARVRARLTLNEGAPGAPCDRYSFHVQRRGADGVLKDTVMYLTSVLGWEIKNFPSSTLVLVRRRLNPQPGQRPDTVAIVPRDGNVIRVYVRQLSDRDRQHLPPETPAAGDPATHFHAYFDLLKVPLAERPVPTLAASQPAVGCSWSFVERAEPPAQRALAMVMAQNEREHAVRAAFWTRIDAASTAGCMVASALPAEP